jgi:hypothetical protein
VRTLTATFVADGSSDHSALTPLITLLLDELVAGPFRLFSAQGISGGHSLEDRLPQALKLFPCDLLLVHRDAETLTVAHREDEITRALAQAGIHVPHVCIVPVRMTEAWLLVDEQAIRSAVGNPTGRVALNLPPRGQIESVAAKERLLQALEVACEFGTHRKRRFQPQQYRHRVAEEMAELTKVRTLSSFRRFEAALRDQLSGWATC